MFNPEEIKKVLGNDEKSKEKLQELLKLLDKTKQVKKDIESNTNYESNTSNESNTNNESNKPNPNNTNQITDKEQRRQILKQRIYNMKAKRMNNSGKSVLQEKLKKKYLIKD